MVKLLAPFSSYEGACAAINSGADEIYCGVAVPELKKLSYSGLATRDIQCSLQTYDELSEVVDYAHRHNAKVLVTTEFPFMANFINNAMKKHLASCAETGIDAFIATDIGIILMATKLHNDISVYASTYLASMNYEAVKFLKQLGVKRVMLERHVTVNEIRDIVRLNQDVEIEVFIHGTGCANINVNCYGCGIPVYVKKESISDKAGTLCTSNYEVYEINDSQLTRLGKIPILDACSWCSLCKLPELIDSGVVGLKIVGREFDVEYQADVTKVYHELIETLENNGKNDFDNKLELFKNKLGLAHICQQKRCYYSNLFHAPYKFSCADTE